MIWSLLLLDSIWIGYEIVMVFAPTQWDQLMVLACAVPLGFTATSWLFLFIRVFIRINPFVGFFVSLFLFFLAMFIHIKRTPKKTYFRSFTPEFTILLAFCYILFTGLIDISILQNGTGSSGTVYSDIPFHLGLITSFAFGANSVNLSMTTPFYYGEKLSYPIIPDFFSGMLCGAGMAPIRIAIGIPTFFLLFSTVIALHFLAFQFSAHPLIPEVAVFCFIFASGVGWKWYFIPECRNDININLCHAFCHDRYTFWIHPLIHFLLPQRSALFSIPLAICILSLLMFSVDPKFASNNTMALAGILMGCLPLLSAHTYIGVGEYAIFLCLLHFPFQDYKKWLDTFFYWAIYGFIAFGLSIPQVVWLLRVPRKGFLTFNPIVTETFPGSYNFFKLWWESLGSFAFIALFLSFVLLGRRQIILYLPSVGVFIVSNLIRYQPGAMDNNKVFFAGWYPVACCCVSHCLVCLYQNSKKNRERILILLGLVVISFSFGSCVCIFRALTHSFTLFTREEMLLGEWIMENTRKDAVFLGSGWHSNVAMSIGGRLITLGYGGWVWTHGLDYYSRIEQIHNMAYQKENVSLFDQYNIQYVFSRFCDDEREFQFTDVPDYSHWIELINVGSVKLYRIVRE